MSNHLPLEERLSIASSKLGLRQPLVLAATGKLPVIVDESRTLTACTNGEWLKFGRKWIEDNDLTDEQLFALALHERLHVMLMHMWRRDGRDMATWNTANDAIINAMIISMNYTLPEGGVVLSWVKPDMSSEDVYDKLRKQQQQKPQPGGQGDEGDEGGQGDEGDEPQRGGWGNSGDLEDAPSEAAMADMEASVRAAAQMARDCGDSSVLVNRILGTPPTATVSWTDELRAVMTSAAREDFTMRKINRRFISRNLYLPSLRSDAMGGLVIGFDTSGSIGPRECAQIAGEIQGIMDDTNPEWVEVVYCDSRISSTQRFARGDVIELKPTGGGGTAFKPVFDYVRDKDEQVAALIYLTDLCSDDLSRLEEPSFPVVWGITYGAVRGVPFGRAVKVNV